MNLLEQSSIIQSAADFLFKGIVCRRTDSNVQLE